MTIWTVPTHLPDLRRVDDNIVAIDTEENDEGLRAGRGSGWPWHGGWICGIIRRLARRRRDARDLHPDTPSRQRQFRSRHSRPLAQGPHRGRRPLRHLERSVMIGAGWAPISASRCRLPDQLEEVGALAALVDENQLKYSLDAHLRPLRSARQGHDAAGGGDQGRRLQDQQEDTRRNPTSGDCRRAMSARMPKTDRDRHARSYTRSSFRSSSGKAPARPIGSKCDLMPVTIAMRRGGIRIDQDAAEQGRDEFLAKRDAALKELSDQHGALVGMDEINSPKWKIATFERYGIISPRKTPKRRAVVHGRQFGMDGRP